MSTQILNFKKVELVAESKEAAVEMMNENYFEYFKDATQAYNLWVKKQNGAVTDKMVKEFMLDYLTKNTKCKAGLGCMITVESAVKDTRERPYRIEKYKNEQGRRKFSRVYTWVDRDTQVVVSSTDTTQANAMNAIKDLYKSGSYKGNADLVVKMEVTEGQSVLATSYYTPSKSTHSGKYIIFGVEA